MILWGWCALRETGLRARNVAVAVVGLARVREYTSKPWLIKMSRSGSLAERKRGVVCLGGSCLEKKEAWGKLMNEEEKEDGRAEWGKKKR